MADLRTDRSRGILHRDGAPERFVLRRYPPSEPLRDLVDNYWLTRWDLDGLPSHRQEILPHPCVHLVVERGHSGAFGIGTGRFVKVLEGTGRAFGIKFWPGAFSRRPAAELSSRGTPLRDVFGPAGAEYEKAALATEDDKKLVGLAEAFVRANCPPADQEARLALRIVASIAEDEDLLRVEAVAERHSLSVRTLQRLFERRVGVPPKWVLQRYRIHEAVERLEAGNQVDFAALAVRLNYFDQAHFVRDFTKLVGRPPGKYVADLSNQGD